MLSSSLRPRCHWDPVLAASALRPARRTMPPPTTTTTTIPIPIPMPCSSISLTFIWMHLPLERLAGNLPPTLCYLCLHFEIYFCHCLYLFLLLLSCISWLRSGIHPQTPIRSHIHPASESLFWLCKIFAGFFDSFVCISSTWPDFFHPPPPSATPNYYYAAGAFPLSWCIFPSIIF